MLVLHHARGRSQGSESGKGNDALSSSNKGPDERDLAPTREPVAVSLADIRHLKRLAEIPNDAPVDFSFGKPAEISAYGATFMGCKTVSRGKIPDTDIALPVVHFLRSQDLFSVVERAEALADGFQIGSRDGDIEVHALMDRRNNLIEVGVSGVSAPELPATLRMSARQAKNLLSKIVHEAAHGAGLNEFGAFRAEADFLHTTGILPEPRSHLEVMLEVNELYRDDPSAIAKAEDEFEAACKRDRQKKQIKAYWAHEGRRLEAHEAGDTLLAEFEREFPADWDSEEAA